MRGIGSEFMKKTRYEYLGPPDQMRGIPQPQLELDCDNAVAVIDLPDYRDCNVKPLTITGAIDKRRSIRSFSDRELALQELSYLLWCTQGVREVMPRSATFRTVPSAGARHAFETYLLVNRVEGLRQGLYRFIAIGHRLADLNAPSGIADEIVKGCLGQNSVGNSAVTFLWAAVKERMCWRYGERGYRYLLLDAGHVCQNLYLAAVAIDCGVCAIGAYDDEAVNRSLGLDGEEHFIIYSAAVGKKV